MGDPPVAIAGKWDAIGQIVTNSIAIKLIGENSKEMDEVLEQGSYIRLGGERQQIVGRLG